MLFKTIIKKRIKQVLRSLYPLINKRYFKALVNKNREQLLKQNQWVESFPGQRVMVLAPHADDEMIGCGGAALKYIRAEKILHIAYLTDSGKRGRVGEKESIPEIRRKEALSVAQAMGLREDRLHFLPGEDGDLEHASIHGALADLIREVKPDALFLPAPMDTHQDHVAAAMLLTETVAGKKDLRSLLAKTVVYLYDVQSPTTWFYANRTLGIETVIREKKKLLGLYRSQNNLMDFAAGMDEYYGYLFEKGPAEVYIETTFPEFIRVTEENFPTFKEQSRHLRQHSNPITLIKSHESARRAKVPLRKYHGPFS